MRFCDINEAFQTQGNIGTVIMSEKLTQSQKKQFQFLLMKALDNETTRSEQYEFERFLIANDECKHEWQQLKELKKVIQDIKFAAPPEEVWDKFWADVCQRLETGLVWILFSMASISH